MTTLGLLHGAWHGAWCWDALVPRLAALSLPSIAMDLPAQEPNAGLDRYAHVAVEALAGVDDLVLVAHSLGGLVAPLVPQLRRVSAIVFLCGLVPEPGRSAREQAAALPGIYSEAYRRAPIERRDDGSTAMPASVAMELLFEDCDPALASDAVTRLRPQHWRLFTETSPMASWPDVPTHIIACREDRLLGVDGQQAAAHMLGVDIHWLPGGHSPMLANPGHLASVLGDMVRQP